MEVYTGLPTGLAKLSNLAKNLKMEKHLYRKGGNAGIYSL